MREREREKEREIEREVDQKASEQGCCKFFLKNGQNLANTILLFINLILKVVINHLSIVFFSQRNGFYNLLISCFINKCRGFHQFGKNPKKVFEVFSNESELNFFQKVQSIDIFSSRPLIVHFCPFKTFQLTVNSSKKRV